MAATRYCGVAVLALATTVYSSSALADPAPNSGAPNFSRTAAGAFSTTVPDGTCSVITSTRGGAGASSGVAATNGGIGGAGAVINARFNVLPGQAVTGTVGSGGVYSTSMTAANNGSGAANGGSAGVSATGFLVHRGGGGGGSSAISVAGIEVVEAGGGGGGGASHNTTAFSNGGNGGFTGIGAGVVAPGVNGLNGSDGSTLVRGGRGGAAAAGGAGGAGAGSLSGFAGGGTASGIGGNGGANDANTDTGGGGGGGYTGGGGGASTTNSSTVSAGGGGGGSSFLRGTSPTLAATAPTSVSGSAGVAPAGGAVNGAAGFVYIDYVPCVYSLAVTKSASATSVNAGQAVRWTITVRNTGTDPMTKGDTVTLTDTLPNGGGSTFTVVSVSTTAGSTDPNMASAAVTCTGVTVGGTMPASTDCSRPYSASSAPGAPSGGTRGLNAGETLTIVYDQVFNNAIPAVTVNNQVSTVDRSGTTVTGSAPNTDTQGVNATRTASASVNVLPYDLRVTKTTSTAALPAGGVITWTVNVTNLGPGAMFGPDATVANPLIVTDVAPTANVSAPVSFTSSGPAGACTYAAGTITCPASLPLNDTQVFTFQQTIAAGTAANTTITNTASATDYVAGDSNDSQAATVTVQGSADLRVVKTNGVSSSFSGSTVTYTVTVTNAGPDPVTGAVVTDVVGAGLTCPASNTVTITGSGSFTIANLTGAGIALGTLTTGQEAVLTYSCQVN